MTISFQPNPWLLNPNLQTIWPNYLRNKTRVSFNTRKITLPDGDFLELCISNGMPNNDSSRGVVFILHGLGGSIESHYSRSLMRAMQLNNLESVFIHFRGASGKPNKKPFSYHAGKADDIAFIIDQIIQEKPDKKYFAIGVSIGGSILVNYLGNYQRNNPLTSAVVISVPYDLYETAIYLDNGFAKNYQRYMMKTLKYDLQVKFEYRECPIDLKKALNAKNLYDFDDAATAPLNNFDTVMDYYKICSAKQYLKNIQTSTLLIHARDDPFTPLKSIPTEDELSNFVKLELYEKGGHVGFIEGNNFWKPTYFLDRRIPAYFSSFILKK